MRPNNFFLYGIVGLALACIRLSSVGIVWDLNVHSTDDWNYLTTINYVSETGDLKYSIGDRPYQAISLMFSQILLPGRFQALFYLSTVLYIVNALSFFHILNLLTGYKWFNFFIAAVYLVYIPHDSHSITSWLVMGTWTLFTGLAAVIALLQFYQAHHHNVWHYSYLSLGMLALYLSNSSYEGGFFLFFCIPPGLWLLYRRWNRAVGLSFVLWYCIITFTFYQFFSNYLYSDQSSYQKSIKEPGLDVWQLIKNSLNYVLNSFNPQIFREINTLILPTSLILTVVFLIACFLLHKKDLLLNQIPSLKQALVMIFVGSVSVVLCSSGFIYAEFEPAGRSIFFAGLGYAVIVGGLISIAARYAKYTLQIPLHYSVMVLGSVLLIISTQWFYAGQSTWGKFPDFADKSIFLRNFVAQLPEVQPNTLILMDECVWQTPYMPFYSTYRLKFLAYLYGEPINTGIQVGNLGDHPFDKDGINFQGSQGRAEMPSMHYGYDQLVILGCDNNPPQLHIMQHFPADRYGPPDADFSVYNPYERILKSFLPQRRQTILAH